RIRLVNDLCKPVSIFDNATFGQREIRFILFINIKISGKNKRKIFCQFLCFSQNKLCTFASGLHTDMVKMRVHKDKALFALPVLKYAPRADSWQCGIPALIRALGVRSRKPKCTLF